MRKLALDIGTASCGFAITDELNIIATGLENYKFPSNEFNFMFDKIFYYLQEYKIDKIIIGLPIRSNGSYSERTFLIEKLGNQIKEKFKIDIFFVNEYGTTIKAEKILKSANINTKKARKIKDKLAAELILQEYLQYHFHKENYE